MSRFLSYEKWNVKTKFFAQFVANSGTFPWKLFVDKMFFRQSFFRRKNLHATHQDLLSSVWSRVLVIYIKKTEYLLNDDTIFFFCCSSHVDTTETPSTDTLFLWPHWTETNVDEAFVRSFFFLRFNFSVKNPQKMSFFSVLIIFNPQTKSKLFFQNFFQR